MKPNDMLAAIMREVRKDVDTVPEGYLCRGQLQKAWKMAKTTTQNFLIKGINKGIIHRIRLRKLGAKGTKIWCYYYKLGVVSQTPKQARKGKA